VAITTSVSGLCWSALTARCRVVCVVLLAMALLTGCWVRLVYGNADNLLRWRIDHFFDLSSEQLKFVDARLAEQLQWHRNEELPKTIEFLRHVQTVAKTSITTDELDSLFADFDVRLSVLIHHVATDAAALFAQLDDQQVAHLERALAKSNDEWEDIRKQEPEIRRAKRIERILGYVEDWIGDLDPAQHEQLATASDRIPDNFDAWLDYRKERQRQFVIIVQTARIDPEVVSVALPSWLAAPPPLEFRDHSQSVRKFILEVERIATPKQRAYFFDKLQHWIDDLAAFTQKSN